MATASNVVSMLNTPARAALLVRFDRVYGRLTCYPVNDAAKLVASLANTKTLTPDTLKLVRQLGLEIIVEHQSWDLLTSFLEQA